ncbi:unnamed protein product [Arabis nemorensis]|uniref:Uncharacterized protein n=1 Tax=Arabis nemorensis TaxID=586526 RepID=A0A565BJY5_9BRAS|nr:unnamed protein product [Arabis nemorensis]
MTVSEDESDDEETKKSLSIIIRLAKELDEDKPVNVAYSLPAEGLEGEDFKWPNEKDDAKDNANAKKGKSKCDAADVSPGRKRKAKRKNLENDKGQTSENITPLTMADMQELIDNSAEFDAKFTCLLQNQDGAIKNDLRDMSETLIVLSEQIVVLKSQQSAVNAETEVGSVAKDILAMTKKSSNQSTTMTHRAKGTTSASLEKATDDLHESEKRLPSSIQPTTSRSGAHMAKDTLDADLQKTTTNPPVIEKDVAPSFQPDKSPSEEGAPNDAHVIKKGGAQPKETAIAQ